MPMLRRSRNLRGIASPTANHRTRADEAATSNRAAVEVNRDGPRQVEAEVPAQAAPKVPAQAATKVPAEQLLQLLPADPEAISSLRGAQ
mmetsp:Transcript_130914/g.280033  ORF Transcript_130914/g.280033 Transcript_130914/m.280033 type:complete len:89 (-) Transcript_130914:380-646(-)